MRMGGAARQILLGAFTDSGRELLLLLNTLDFNTYSGISILATASGTHKYRL
jgi:hypothetical protein